MKCPFCQSEQLIVSNTRSTNGGVEIWRRRLCLSCNGKITTHEKIDLSYVLVIKRSQKNAKYNRAKLFSGIYQAVADTKNLDRGTAGIMAEKILVETEKEIVIRKIKQITSTEILFLVASILKKTSFDSYLRYISYFAKNTELKSYL